MARKARCAACCWKMAVPGAVDAIRALEGDIAAQQVRRFMGLFGVEEM